MIQQATSSSDLLSSLFPGLGQQSAQSFAPDFLQSEFPSLSSDNTNLSGLSLGEDSATSFEQLFSSTLQESSSLPSIEQSTLKATQSESSKSSDDYADIETVVIYIEEPTSSVSSYNESPLIKPSTVVQKSQESSTNNIGLDVVASEKRVAKKPINIGTPDINSYQSEHPYNIIGIDNTLPLSTQVSEETDTQFERSTKPEATVEPEGGGKSFVENTATNPHVIDRPNTETLSENGDINSNYSEDTQSVKSELAKVKENVATESLRDSKQPIKNIPTETTNYIPNKNEPKNIESDVAQNLVEIRVMQTDSVAMNNIISPKISKSNNFSALSEIADKFGKGYHPTANTESHTISLVDNAIEQVGIRSTNNYTALDLSTSDAPSVISTLNNSDENTINLEDYKSTSDEAIQLIPNHTSNELTTGTALTIPVSTAVPLLTSLLSSLDSKSSITTELLGTNDVPSEGATSSPDLNTSFRIRVSIIGNNNDSNLVISKENVLSPIGNSNTLTDIGSGLQKDNSPESYNPPISAGGELSQPKKTNSEISDSLLSNSTSNTPESSSNSQFEVDNITDGSINDALRNSIEQGIVANNFVRPSLSEFSSEDSTLNGDTTSADTLKGELPKYHNQIFTGKKSVTSVGDIIELIGAVNQAGLGVSDIEIVVDNTPKEIRNNIEQSLSARVIPTQSNDIRSELLTQQKAPITTPTNAGYDTNSFADFGNVVNGGLRNSKPISDVTNTNKSNGNAVNSIPSSDFVSLKDDRNTTVLNTPSTIPVKSVADKTQSAKYVSSIETASTLAPTKVEDVEVQDEQIQVSRLDSASIQESPFASHPSKDELNAGIIELSATLKENPYTENPKSNNPKTVDKINISPAISEQLKVVAVSPVTLDTKPIVYQTTISNSVDIHVDTLTDNSSKSQVIASINNVVDTASENKTVLHQPAISKNVVVENLPNNKQVDSKTLTPTKVEQFDGDSASLLKQLNQDNRNTIRQFSPSSIPIAPVEFEYTISQHSSDIDGITAAKENIVSLPNCVTENANSTSANSEYVISQHPSQSIDDFTEQLDTSSAQINRTPESVIPDYDLAKAIESDDTSISIDTITKSVKDSSPRNTELTSDKESPKDINANSLLTKSTDSIVENSNERVAEVNDASSSIQVITQPTFDDNTLQSEDSQSRIVSTKTPAKQESNLVANKATLEAISEVATPVLIATKPITIDAEHIANKPNEVGYSAVKSVISNVEFEQEIPIQPQLDISVKSQTASTPPLPSEPEYDDNSNDEYIDVRDEYINKGDSKILGFAKQTNSQVVVDRHPSIEPDKQDSQLLKNATPIKNAIPNRVSLKEIEGKNQSQPISITESAIEATSILPVSNEIDIVPNTIDVSSDNIRVSQPNNQEVTKADSTSFSYSTTVISEVRNEYQQPENKENLTKSEVNYQAKNETKNDTVGDVRSIVRDLRSRSEIFGTMSLFAGNSSNRNNTITTQYVPTHPLEQIEVANKAVEVISPYSRAIQQEISRPIISKHSKPATTEATLALDANQLPANVGNLSDRIGSMNKSVASTNLEADVDIVAKEQPELLIQRSGSQYFAIESTPLQKTAIPQTESVQSGFSASTDIKLSDSDSKNSSEQNTSDSDNSNKSREPIITSNQKLSNTDTSYSSVEYSVADSAITDNSYSASVYTDSRVSNFNNATTPSGISKEIATEIPRVSKNVTPRKSEEEVSAILPQTKEPFRSEQSQSAIISSAISSINDDKRFLSSQDDVANSEYEYISSVSANNKEYNSPLPIHSKELLNANELTTSVNTNFNNVLSSAERKPENNTLSSTQTQSNGFSQQQLATPVNTIPEQRFIQNKATAEQPQQQTQLQVPIGQFVPTTSTILRNFTASNGGSVKMILSPEALGTVVVKLTMNERQSKLVMEVESSATKSIIESQLKTLQDQLSQNGVSMDSISVNVRSESRQSSMDFNQGNQSQQQSAFMSQDNTRREQQQRNNEENKQRLEYLRSLSDESLGQQNPDARQESNGKNKQGRYTVQDLKTLRGFERIA